MAVKACFPALPEHVAKRHIKHGLEYVFKMPWQSCGSPRQQRRIHQIGVCDVNGKQQERNKNEYGRPPRACRLQTGVVPFYKEIEWNKCYEKRSDKPYLVSVTAYLKKVPAELGQEAVMRAERDQLRNRDVQHAENKPRHEQCAYLFHKKAFKVLTGLVSIACNNEKAEHKERREKHAQFISDALKMFKHYSHYTYVFCNIDPCNSFHRLLQAVLFEGYSTLRNINIFPFRRQSRKTPAPFLSQAPYMQRFEIYGRRFPPE